MFHAMDRVSNGNLDITLDKKYFKGDEIGKMLVCFEKTLKNLRSIMLKEQNECNFLNSLINDAGVFIVLLDLDGRIVKLNNFGQKILGISSQEIVERDWFEFAIPEDIRKEMDIVFDDVKKGILPQNFENPVMSKNGNRFDILWNNSMVYDQDNRPLVLSMGIDISDMRAYERKLKDSYSEVAALYEELTATEEELRQQVNELQKNQEALTASEERYRLSVEGANDVLWDWDIKTDKVFLSDKWKEITGYDAGLVEDFLDIWKSIVHPQDLSDAFTELQNHLKGITEIFSSEYRIQTADCRLIWVFTRGKMLVDKDGRAARIAGSITDITSRKNHEAQIQQLAYYDSLTGLPNRALFLKRLNSLLEEQKNGSEIGALLFLDLDNFKMINDTFEHDTGDKLLAAAGENLRMCIEEEKDIVVRLGGDEFIILKPGIKGPAEVSEFANKLLDVFKRAWKVDIHEFYLTASVGITIYPTDGTDAGLLLKNADMAMYRAKETGKNKFCFFEQQMNESVQQKMKLEKGLHDAIKKCFVN